MEPAGVIPAGLFLCGVSVMIKMKALRSFGVRNANEGKVMRGREFTAANEHRARDLEDEGLAYRIETKMQPVHLNKMEPPPSNKAAEAGPLDSVGGTTGAGAPAPSSPPDHPQRKRRSMRSKADDLLS
jgi:hypothetical protein